MPAADGTSRAQARPGPTRPSIRQRIAGYLHHDPLRRAWYDLHNWLRGLDLEPVDGRSIGLPESSTHYSDSGGPDLDRVLCALGLPTDSGALDVGCGKGGSLITLSRHFARADGVELAESLAEVARANLRRAAIMNANVIVADATRYDRIDDYGCLYLFNPFGGEVFSDFLRRVEASLARRPRTLTMIYAFAAEHQRVVDAGYAVTTVFRHGFFPVVVYRR